MDQRDEQIKELLEQIKGLREKIEALEREVQRVQTENAELRRRLGQNSQNSSKPPSSDGYRKTGVRRPGLPKGENRKAGGQEGHKGETLRQVERADKVEIHMPTECKVCGRAIRAEEGCEVVGKRQVFDLPEAKMEVTEHQIGQVICCGQAQSGEYPEDVKASVQYGAGVRAMVTKLSVDHRMPLEQISILFSDLYGYHLNSETIETTLEQGYELAGPIEKEMKEQLVQAEVVHFDETGLRVEGKLQWLHTASNGMYTYLFVHAKRGKNALESEDSILKDFNGRAIHDCWVSYFEFEHILHGVCCAHLLRELQGLVEAKSLWAQEMHTFLLNLYKQTRTGPLEGWAAEQACLRYQEILSQAEQEEPPPISKGGKGRPKSTPGRNLLHRLRQYQHAVLAFALVKGVPFTNNLAEQSLRPAKVKQKVSGGFRTLQGARVYARLQAIIATCRKQGKNVFLFLRDIFALHPVSLLAG